MLHNLEENSRGLCARSHTVDMTVTLRWSDMANVVLVLQLICKTSTSRCFHCIRSLTTITSAAALCCAKTRPKVARVWRPSWGGPEQSDFGQIGRSLKHEAVY